MSDIIDLWTAKSVRVCRGVLRVWGTSIQDSRTDFGSKSRKFIRLASTRGWCKIKTPDGIVGGIRIDRVLNVETETQDRVDGIDVGVYECLL